MRLFGAFRRRVVGMMGMLRVRMSLSGFRMVGNGFMRLTSRSTRRRRELADHPASQPHHEQGTGAGAPESVRLSLARSHKIATRYIYQ